MLDRINNQILSYLESKSWTVATVYWRLFGHWVKV